MNDNDREARIEKLRRLVQSGEYQVDAQDVASSLVDESTKPDLAQESAPITKTANTSGQ